MELGTDGVYIVTGGAGALAGAVARVFRDAGARLALVDLPGTPLAERAAEHHALAIEADLTSVDAARAMVERTRAAFGRVDGLIHTAGGFTMGAAHEADDAAYDRMLGGNLRTLVCAVRAALPAFLEQGGGFIAGISSGIVWRGTGAAGLALYAAAKGALTFYLRSLEAEVRDRGVRVAVVFPLTSIDTPANRRDRPDFDPREWVDPEEIATALLFAATRGPRGRLAELPIGVGR